MCALVTSRDDAHFLDVCKAIHRAKNLTDDDRRVLFMVAIQHAPSAELALAAYETGRDSVTASPDELVRTHRLSVMSCVSCTQRHVLLLRALLIKSSNDRPIARAAAWDFLKTPLTEEAFFDVTSKLIRLTSPKEMDAFMAEAESVSTAWGRLLVRYGIESDGHRSHRESGGLSDWGNAALCSRWKKCSRALWHSRRLMWTRCAPPRLV